MSKLGKRIAVGISLISLFLFGKVGPVLADFYDNELVPCGIKGDLCTLCHFVLMAQNIFVFLIKISFIIALVFAVIVGILQIVSGGASRLIAYAATLLKYTLIGFAICLLCYVAVNAIATALGYTGQGGSWARPQINCEAFRVTSTNVGPGPGGYSSPVGSPSVTPTASPTVSPSASPTASPSVSPSASPTASPSPSPALFASPDPVEFTMDGQTQQMTVTYDDGKGSVAQVQLFNRAEAASSNVTNQANYKIADNTIASVSESGLIKNEQKIKEGEPLRHTNLTIQYKDQTKDVSVIVHTETCPVGGIINGEPVSYDNGSHKKRFADSPFFKDDFWSIPSAKAAGCTDSDGGKTYNLRGTTQDPWGIDVDHCYDKSRASRVQMCTATNTNCVLVEYFCQESKTPGGAPIIERKGEFYGCGGQGCSNGACASASPTPTPSSSNPPGSPTPTPTVSPSGTPKPSGPGSGEWQITTPSPNEFELETLKSDGADKTKICFVNPTDALSKVKNMYYFPYQSDYPNLRKIYKTAFHACQTCKGQTVFMDVKYYEGMVIGDYDVYIEDEKGRFERFQKAFKIKGQEAKDCTPLSDKSLKEYDSRIPIVYVANSDYGTNIEAFRSYTNGNVFPIADPANLSNYTVWRSEKIGTNACPSSSKMLVVDTIAGNNNSCGSTALACTYRASSTVWLYAQRTKGMKIGEILTHEMGHAHGNLQDEYFPYNQKPSQDNNNCYQGANGDACKHFQGVAKEYDCAGVREGCNYVATGWWRSIEKGMMWSYPNSNNFGVVGGKLYNNRMWFLK